ncbi:MAG: MMPL family transporter, partial [Salinirussus sp.]
MNSQRSDVGTLLAQIAGLAAQYRRSVIILTLVVLLLSGGLAASSVQLDMGVGLYLGDDSEAAEDWASVEETYDRGNAVFVVLDGRDVTDPATIRIIDALDRQYTQLDEVSRSSSLADVVRAGAGGRIPDSEQAVERAIGRVRTQSPASAELVDSVLPSNTRTQLILSYGELRSAGDEGPFGLIVRKDAERVESAVERATDRIRLPDGLTLTITGPGILEMAAFELMLIDALALFAGGFLVVLVVVYLVMRRRLHSGLQALYSLVVALASVIVMLGGMGLLGFDFNAIMIAVLPVGVGLSVDYALQLHTRYAEERTTGVPPAEAAETAAATTGRALGLAMGTTVVGFGSLLVSPVPPVRQFGVTAAIVVAAAFVFALTLLVALLVTTDRRSGRSGPSTLSPDTGALEGGLRRVGGLIAQEPLVVLLLVIPLLAGGAAAYPQIDTTQEILDYWPRDLTERKQFENTLETTASPKTVYALVETADVYEPETIRAIDRFQSRIASLHHVNAVGGPISALRSITGGTIPDDRERIETLLTKASHGPLTSTTPPDTHPNEVLITARIGDIEGREISALVEDIHAAAATELPDASVTVTGTPVVTRAVIENTTEGLGRMTVLSFIAALCFLVLAFRSFRDAMMLLAVPAAAATFVL